MDGILVYSEVVLPVLNQVIGNNQDLFKQNISLLNRKRERKGRKERERDGKERERGRDRMHLITFVLDQQETEKTISINNGSQHTLSFH